MVTESELVVDRLIAAGAHEMARTGWRGASLADIAARAGESDAAAVAYHFGSREGLLFEIVARGITQVEPERWRLLESLTSESSLAEYVDATLRPMADQLLDPWSRDFVRLSGQLGEFFRSPIGNDDGPFAGSAIYRLRMAMVDVLAARGGQARAVERLRVFDAVSVAALALRGTELQAWIDATGEVPDAAAVSAGRLTHEEYVDDLVAQLTAALSA